MNLKNITHQNIDDAYKQNDDENTKAVLQTCEQANAKDLKKFFLTIPTWEIGNKLAQFLHEESEQFTISHYLLKRNEEVIIDIRKIGEAKR